jgi:hypothetical protein
MGKREGNPTKAAEKCQCRYRCGYKPPSDGARVRHVGDHAVCPRCLIFVRLMRVRTGLIDLMRPVGPHALGRRSGKCPPRITSTERKA